MSTALKRATVLVLGTLLVLIVSGWSASMAAEATPLAGTVKDTLGQVVAGVEILFVRLPAATFTPTAVTHSDKAGRFEIRELLEARYRFAALKQGYVTLIGQVDTAAQDSIDMVLRPTVALDTAALPALSSWALRLPRRGMLHDIGPRPLPAVDDGARTASRNLDDALSMELEQFFSISADAIESNPQETGIEPSRSRMLLSSAIGERGNIQIAGQREQLGATIHRESPDSSASQDGAVVSVDLSYETSPDARINVSAYYNQTDYELSAQEGPAPLKQQQQTWGYDASWSKQIDATRRIALALGFQDSSMVSPLREELSTPVVPGAVQNGVANRSVDASGSYQRVMNESHDLQVDLRTQMLRSPTAPLSSVRRSPVDRSTWTVHADARDTWSISVPFSLVYGLGYKQSLMTSADTLVVPKLGGNLTAGGWFVRALVSYHTVMDSGLPVEAAYVPFRPEHSLGYEAELQLPLARDLRVSGATTYTPIQFDYFGYLHGADGPGEHPLYLTDGNSAVHEHRVTLVEERGESRTYLELSSGQVEGSVAPLLPFDGALPAVAGRDLRYRSGRLGFVFPAFRTDLRFEYRRVEASGTEERRALTDSIQESVEMRVKTDVPATQIPGDWRVLLALRMGRVRSVDLEEWSSYEGAETVDALNRRISAGVAVLF